MHTAYIYTQHTCTYNIHTKHGSGEDFGENIGSQIECSIHEKIRYVHILVPRTRGTHRIIRCNSAYTVGFTKFRSMLRSNYEIHKHSDEQCESLSNGSWMNAARDVSRSSQHVD